MRNRFNKNPPTRFELRGTGLLALGLATLASLASGVGVAQAAVINTSDRGGYNDAGFHSPSNDNFAAGNAFIIVNNFFVFDLSSLSGAATSASLRLFNPSNGFFSSDSTETYQLFDVSTNLVNLTGGTGGVAAFLDLGSGAVFGTATVSTADNGAWVVVNLNAAGLAAVQTALGGNFAVGGAITTLDGNFISSEYLFGNTGGPRGSPTDTQLDVQFAASVPEPMSLSLLGAGLAGLGALRRRRG